MERFMSALERHPQGLAPTPHMVLGTGIDGRGIPIGPMVKRVPEVPVVTREHLPQLGKIQEVLPSRRDEAHFC